jgi:hypothetical protein
LNAIGTKVNAEPRGTANSSAGQPVIDAVDERGAQRLMIALVMIVVDEFPDRPPEVPLADRIIRSRHSSVIDRTNRSADAFAFGASSGV